jgi:PAS domain S-box-containing protein
VVAKKISSEMENLKSKISDPQTLHILMIEDSEDDALLLMRRLKKGGYRPVYERVETAAAMKKAVKTKQWDIILCDYKMPRFSAPSAIALLKEIKINIPIIIISGNIGEETAIECMRLGAHDYIMKSNLSRLCPAIARELKEARARKKQKNTENKLHQEEQRFRALAEQSSDIIALVDPEGTALYENPAVEKYLGFNPEERIGKKVFENIHPDDLKIITDSFNALFKDKNVPIKEPKEVRLRHKDGSWRTFEIAASNLVNNNVIEATIVNLRDITQRKMAENALRESERKYRLITEKMTDIVWVADMALRVIYVTPSVYTILGLTQEEIKNQTLEEKLTPGSLSFCLETMASELAIEEQGHGDPNRTVNLVLEYYHKDGEILWMETIIGGLRNDQGVLTGLHGVARDITKRKQAEDALRQSEERYSTILEEMDEGYQEVDLNGNFTFVNDAFLRIFGYSRDEMMGTNFRQHSADEETAKKIFYAYNEMFKTGIPIKRSIEWNIIRKDGDRRICEFYASLLSDANGLPIGFRGIGRDITERKQTERSLREKDEILHGITQNLPGNIFQFFAKDSGEYGTNYISEPLTKDAKIISNIDSTKLENVFPEFLSRIHEEDRDRFLASIKTAVETVTPWNFEGRVLHPGKVIWFQGLSTPQRHEDQTVFDGILLNITDRKLAEEKFRQSEEKFYKIFMTSPNCIAITRLKDGLITDVNKGFEDIVGWKRKEAIGTKSTESPLNFWVDLSERNFMTAELGAGRDIMDRQFEFRRSDGSVRAAIYSARPINISGEECLIFIMQDITEQKKMERALVESHEMRLMNQIASGVAHEVRNPLHAIQAISEAMAMDMDEKSDYKDYLMHIKEQVARLSHLMNDLLDLGKPMQPSQFSQTLLTEIVAYALRSWMDAHPHLSLNVRVVNNLQPDDMVLVDTNKIQQVIINLIENAAQHSPQGEEILLTLGKVSGNCFMVEIIDKGEGLKPQDKPKVFEPFYTTRKSGTGLGLSLCKHIIESHGGMIEIVSNINARGCTARFTLPAYNKKEYK